MKRLVLAVLVSMLLLAGAAQAAATTRPVLWVGNNWDDTADAIDPFTFKKLAHLNIKKGCQEADGPTALGYARSRHAFQNGDLDRESVDIRAADPDS